MKHLWLLMLIVALLTPAMPARAQDNPTLQALLDEAIAQGTPGVVVWSAGPDGTTFAVAGYSDSASSIPLTPTDAFRAGSITKILTATLILQLMEEGVLTLDDTVGRWLPDVAANLPNGDIITLRQLLNHTAGVVDYTSHPAFLQAVADDPDRVWQPRELVATIYDQEADFVAGTSFAYGNTGYILLGMVIEAATGQAYVEVLRERLLEPLGMVNTYLADAEEPTSTVVEGFSTSGAGRVHGSSVWASGALVTTAPDMAAFMQALFGGQVFQNPRTLTTMQQTVAVAPGAAYGLGMLYIEDKWWGHDGGIMGFSSLVLVDPQQATVVVIWSNIDDSVGVGASAVLTALGLD